MVGPLAFRMTINQQECPWIWTSGPLIIRAVRLRMDLRRRVRRQLLYTSSPCEFNAILLKVISTEQQSKLYKIVAEIIEKVYTNNYRTSISLDHQSSSSKLFQQIISLEPQLAKWKAELPPQLAIKTKEDILHDLQDSSIFSPLSTVITFRYISTRTLLHRPMIIRFLDHDPQKPGSVEEWSFLKDFGRASLEVGVRSAVEMIEIIYTASEGDHLMLTTWWFSLYYGQYLPPSCFLRLTTLQCSAPPLSCLPRWSSSISMGCKYRTSSLVTSQTAFSEL